MHTHCGHFPDITLPVDFFSLLSFFANIAGFEMVHGPGQAPGAYFSTIMVSIFSDNFTFSVGEEQQY